VEVRYYARKAKGRGYGARSVFKLQEIDERERLIKPGLMVLDLGASPGSWMQYVSERLEKKGVVVGLDLKALKRPLKPNERFVKGDVYELSPDDVSKDCKRFDLILSDMMPNTIGHKASDHYRSIALAERALYFVDGLLRPGGHFLIKVWQGSDFEAYRDMLRERFRKVKIKKPRSSRPNSREVYLLALSKKKFEEVDSDG
jgi:23S rRNA (uridine2552-2'-O)-methyltransferase